jgi:DNA-binding NarL/FixJ family response regulator
MRKTKILRAICVLVVDDHAIVREGICHLLAQQRDLKIVGQATDGEQALTQVAALHPDVVLMDIAMPQMNGLEATQKIVAAFPATRILVLTQHETMDYVLPLMRAGAAGYMLKAANAQELTRAIRAVHTEGAFLPPSILRTLVDGIAQARAAQGQASLTEREREILRLIAEGLGVNQVAKKLCISAKTVITHRGNIMEKLGVHNTVELIKYAIREGIVKA